MRERIVVVGSLNADLVVSVARFPAPGETVPGSSFAVFPGGKGANQAYAAARLGGTVAMVGRVGADANAALLTGSLASAGVDVAHVGEDSSSPTGVALITIDAAGQNHIVVVPGANGTFDVRAVERGRELISGAAIVLLQLEVPLTTVAAAARVAREGGAVVILDPAPAHPLSPDVLATVDYLTPNESELAALTSPPAGQRFARDEAAERAQELVARGARRVVVKLGDRGALLVTPDRVTAWPAIPVDPVDTTAAGDAFNAAFAVALSTGATDDEAGAFATAAAACSVAKRGAQPSMPTALEVEALLAAQTEGPRAS